MVGCGGVARLAMLGSVFLFDFWGIENKNEGNNRKHASNDGKIDQLQSHSSSCVVSHLPPLSYALITFFPYKIIIIFAEQGTGPSLQTSIPHSSKFQPSSRLPQPQNSHFPSSSRAREKFDQFQLAGICQTKSLLVQQQLNHAMNPNDSNNPAGEMVDEAAIKEGKWTDEEHHIFLAAYEAHKDQWKIIAEAVKTRTPSQVRSHAQKYVNKLENDKLKIGNNLSAILDQTMEGTFTRGRQRASQGGLSKEEDRKHYNLEVFAPEPRTQRKQSKKEKKERHPIEEEEKPQVMPEKRKLIGKTTPRKDRNEAESRQKKQELPLEPASPRSLLLPTFFYARPRSEQPVQVPPNVGQSFFAEVILPWFEERGVGWKQLTELNLYQLIDGHLLCV